MYFVAYCADNMENDSLTQVGSSEKLCIYHSSKVIQLPNFSLQRDKKTCSVYLWKQMLRSSVDLFILTLHWRQICRTFYNGVGTWCGYMHMYQHTDLSMMFLILLKHLNHQLSQTDRVLQFFGRGGKPSHIFWSTKVKDQCGYPLGVITICS